MTDNLPNGGKVLVKPDGQAYRWTQRTIMNIARTQPSINIYLLCHNQNLMNILSKMIVRKLIIIISFSVSLLNFAFTRLIMARESIRKHIVKFIQKENQS